MEDLLYMKDLHEFIKGDEANPTDLNDKKWAQLNQKTIGTIRSWIDQSVYHHVVKEFKTGVLWRKLETIYEQLAAQNRVNMMKKLVNLKYKEGRNITERTSEFQGLVNQLTTMKIILDDELQALLLLSYLPDNWETLVVSVNNSESKGKLTFDMATDKLRNEESQRKNAEVVPSESVALVSENQKR